jgi:hypothetical protein
VAAARTVFEWGYRGVELEDLAERLAALEEKAANGGRK